MYTNYYYCMCHVQCQFSDGFEERYSHLIVRAAEGTLLLASDLCLTIRAYHMPTFYKYQPHLLVLTDLAKEGSLKLLDLGHQVSLWNENECRTT